MYNPIFDMFGGRKSFNAYLGVVLVITWAIFKLDPESLYLALGLLGLTNATIAFEDSRKSTTNEADIEIAKIEAKSVIDVVKEEAKGTSDVVVKETDNVSDVVKDEIADLTEVVRDEANANTDPKHVEPPIGTSVAPAKPTGEK